LIAERAQQTSDPFSRRDGFRAYGLSTRRFQFEWQGGRVDAVLTYLHDGALSLSMSYGAEKTDGLLHCERSSDAAIRVSIAGERFEASVHPEFHEKGLMVNVFTAKGATKLIVIDPFLQVAEGGAQVGRLTAPMPGKLVSFAVKAGDVVKAGQTLAVMEAMKMEHTIAAPRDGVVAEILFAPGDQVSDGVELIKLASA